MARCRGVLVDIAGVLHVDWTPIPRSIEALARLRALEIPFRFLTNTDMIAKEKLVKQLNDIGFALQAEEVLTSPQAAVNLLREIGAKNVLLDCVHPETQSEFLEFNTDKSLKCDAVVLTDMEHHWNYEIFTRAFRALMESPQAPLVATGGARYYKATDGLRLDVGAFSKALEFASGREAIIVGKPSSAFFNAALAETKCDSSDAIMIGDDVVSDIGGSQACGIRGILVRTGKYTPEDEKRDGITPFAIMDDFMAAVESIERAEKQRE